jgi:hypothetical protein
MRYTNVMGYRPCSSSISPMPSQAVVDKDWNGHLRPGPARLPVRRTDGRRRMETTRSAVKMVETSTSRRMLLGLSTITRASITMRASILGEGP